MTCMDVIIGTRSALDMDLGACEVSTAEGM
jgi:hypothetical protein